MKEPVATPAEVAAILAAYREREASKPPAEIPASSSPASSSRQVRRAGERAAAKKAPTRVAAGSQVPARSIRGADPVRAPKPRSKAKRARRDTFLASLEARGARGCRSREIPSRAATGAIAIRANRTGAGARHALQHHFPTAWRGPLYALALDPGDGRRLPEDLSHEWSRWVIACAFLLWRMRRRSLRNGAAGVVDGVTQGMICGLFKNARGRSYSRSRLFATSYRRGTRECGPMVALVRAGLCWRQQPRESEANPRFVGPPKALADGTTRRFAFAITWLVLPLPPD